jgi:hypothetical protein
VEFLVPAGAQSIGKPVRDLDDGFSFFVIPNLLAAQKSPLFSRYSLKRLDTLPMSRSSPVLIMVNSNIPIFMGDGM